MITLTKTENEQITNDTSEKKIWTENKETTEVSLEKKIWKDEEFMQIPDDGNRYEIINGDLIIMGNSGAKHGYICSLLLGALINYIIPKKLGVILDSSTAFKMKAGNKRSPDISFISKERLQGLEELPDDFLEGAPTLAIEIISPGNTFSEIHDKLVEYFDNGTNLAWVVYPQEEYILVYRNSQTPEFLLQSNQTLEGEDIVPGFSLSVSYLFEKLSF